MNNRLFPIQAIILQADARTIPLRDQSVHCVVTSPPYWGLRDYGVEGQLGLEKTPEEYLENMVAVFREVWRVLRDDGTAWVNMGDCYAHGKPGGGGVFDNGRNDGRDWYEGDKARGRVKNSTLVSGLKPKDLVGMPWRLAFALQADGWYLRSDIIWSKPNPMPESVTDRPTKAHEYVFLLSKKARYYYDVDAVREEGVRYKWNTQKFKGGDISKHHGSTIGKEIGDSSAGRNLRDVWHIATQPYPEAHFATYPEKLVEPCVKAGCPAGGIVFDPFGGSGTTATVALKLGRRAAVMDIGYHDLARKRVD